jgi:hypothetical protein
MFKDKVITLNTAQLFLKLKKEDDYKDEQPLFFNLKKEGGSEVKGVGLKIGSSPVDGLPYEPFELNKNLGKWSIVLNEEYYIADDETHIDPNLSLVQKITIDGVDHYRLIPEAIEDIFIVFEYSVETLQE